MVDIVGCFAVVLVLLSASMRDMARLRFMAILSNFAFISYGLMADVMPVLALHAILLPIHAYALWSIQSGKRDAGFVVRSKPAIHETSRRRTSPRNATVRDAG